MDGMRAYLEREFDAIYIVDLAGNVRKFPQYAGTTHNVFGIKVGVCVSFLIRRSATRTGTTKLNYVEAQPGWRKEKKLQFLQDNFSLSKTKWIELTPDTRHNWIDIGESSDYAAFTPIRQDGDETGLFKQYSLGVSTNRDAVAYNFSETALMKNVTAFAKIYNAEQARFQLEKPDDLDKWLDEQKLKWSRNLKRHFRGGDALQVSGSRIRGTCYRPFTQMQLYLADIVVDEPASAIEFSPLGEPGYQNRTIYVTDVGGRSDFSVLVTDRPADLHFCASSDGFQGFPVYTYDEDSSNRCENITDWAL